MFVEVIADLTGFISYYPLKQGLKHWEGTVQDIRKGKIYILLSIKTRIETCNSRGFLS